MHHITLKQDDGNGSTYSVDLDVEVETPTLDSASADPGTTDITFSVTLASGTLTNTSTGGLPVEPAGMPWGFFLGPTAAANSFTCRASQSDGQWGKVDVLSPYAGCGVMGDILVDTPEADSNPGGILPAGQSEGLNLVDSMSAKTTIEVPTPDAQKVADELAAGKVCLLITSSNQASGTEPIIEGSSVGAGACG